MIHLKNYTFKVTTFSGGEIHPVLSEKKGDRHENRFGKTLAEDEILGDIWAVDELYKLALVYNAWLYETPHISSRKLLLPYLPYARQDRVTEKGTANALEVVMNFIQGFPQLEEVTVWDAHSHRYLDHVKRGILWYNQTRNHPCELMKEDAILVAPDAGAATKVFQYSTRIAKALEKTPKILFCQKTRDPATGRILGLDFQNPEQIKDQKRFVIADDICDGGRTFVETADKILALIPDAEITLAVTHALMSKGFEPFKGKISRILTKNPHPDVQLHFAKVGSTPFFSHTVKV